MPTKKHENGAPDRKRKNDGVERNPSSPTAPQTLEDPQAPKIKRKQYEQGMRLLHAELVAVQEWVKATGAKICLVFEGRGTAGKRGTIKRTAVPRTLTIQRTSHQRTEIDVYAP